MNQPAPTNGWLISDWAAGQTSIMNWEADNVRRTTTGAVELVLDQSAVGASRPYAGGEIQSSEVATTGTFAWRAQAPVMKSGAVFGMFTYRADWQNQPWTEFDFEFVGSDTTKVQLNIHMENPQGQHVSLDQKQGKPIIVDLGFDAAKGMHDYEVVVTTTNATFFVDGKMVGQYNASDMPQGVWQIGPQKSFVDLWCASGLDGWAGKWAGTTTPLVGKVEAYDIRPNDISDAQIDTSVPTPTPAPSPVTEATDLANVLSGTDGNDSINALGGNDTIGGGNGHDTLFGGAGDDHFRLDAGNDVLNGGDGTDWLDISGSAAVTIDLNFSGAQNTGYGSDIITGIENLSGGAGADRFLGTDGANQLSGNDGADTLIARGGNDTVSGGNGDDSLTGGLGNDLLSGDVGQDRLQIDGGDDVLDGGEGNDTAFYTGSAGISVNLALTTAQVTGSGSDIFRNIENLSGGTGADRLTGNSGANQLSGNDGADTLNGGAGADTLSGGAGRDYLAGGQDSDRDVFIFNSTADAGNGSTADVIQNFTSAIDDIDLRGIDANSGAGGDQAFRFTGSTAATNAVWFTQVSGGVMVHGDVNGDGKADFDLTVQSVTSLLASDFLL